MISRKRLYDLSERVTDYVMDRAATFAFPGRDAPLPPVLLIALPKSGSVYLQRALRRTLRVQVHHITGGGMSGSSFRHVNLCRFEQGNVVSREHLQPRAVSVKVLARHGISKAVLHVRDPRAAIVSWTRHMDRMLDSRGLRAVELSCELPMPDAYSSWDFSRRLHWQVENKMPDFVRWIEDWLALVESGLDVDFLVTDYAELQDDSRRLVARILEFYGIAYDPEWISLPSTRFGRNNIYTVLENSGDRSTSSIGEARMRRWATQMSREALAAAHALLPTPLADRFGWVKA